MGDSDIHHGNTHISHDIICPIGTNKVCSLSLRILDLAGLSLKLRDQNTKVLVSKFEAPFQSHRLKI